MSKRVSLRLLSWSPVKRPSPSIFRRTSPRTIENVASFTSPADPRCDFSAPRQRSNSLLLAITVASLGVTALVVSYTRRVPEPMDLLDHELPTSVQYGTLSDMTSAITEIRSTLHDTENVISTDDSDLRAHGYSESSYVRVDVLPVAVAYPRNTEQVSVIAKICHKWKVPIIPYSGGTSLEAHTAAPFGGISIDFEWMDKVVAYHDDDMDVVVQPGVNWTDLNDDLAGRDSKLFFPIDPAPSARIGGMIGTNCSGTNAVRYGTMRNWVLNVTMVLADGRIIKTRRRPRKCSAGYDLTGLVVGSEGTLGIVTEATLKLAARPQHTSVAVLSFSSLTSAVSAAAAVIRQGVPVAALELMDEVQMRLINDSGVTQPHVWKEVPTLFLKFSGTRGIIENGIESVRAIAKACEPLEFHLPRNEEEESLLWAARKESLYAIMSMRKPGQAVWGTDVAVPLSRLAEIIEASKADGDAAGLQVSVKGHVGDANFHENILYDQTNPKEAAKAARLVKIMVDRAIEMDGTCTGEHGIGFGKKDSLLKELGNDTVAVMKLIKRALDPHWIMNPGKIFDLEHRQIRERTTKV